MLKFDTKIVLKTLKGEVIKDDTGEVTAALVISNILSGQTTNPARAYQLAKKFATEDIVDLKAEDVVFIKEQVEGAAKQSMSSLVAGQLLELLDGAEDKK